MAVPNSHEARLRTLNWEQEKKIGPAESRMVFLLSRNAGNPF
jgi:hypothetical protein